MRPQLELYKRGWICEHLCTRRVSLRVSLWDWQDLGNKGTISKTNINELIVLLQGIAFGSSPYRFPYFGATFKTKERLT